MRTSSATLPAARRLKRFRCGRMRSAARPLSTVRGSEPKARYCPDGQCNSEELKRLIGVLADPRASPRQRNEALKWVVHLVGDLHQPLHAADNDDRGGNL